MHMAGVVGNRVDDRGARRDDLRRVPAPPMLRQCLGSSLRSCTAQPCFHPLCLTLKHVSTGRGHVRMLSGEPGAYQPTCPAEPGTVVMLEK